VGLALCAALALLSFPQVTLAHGGVTGVQDVVQDYGVFIFLIAVVLIGAGVLTWVMLSPQEDEPEESDVHATD
jgi:hypothetical protein